MCLLGLISLIAIIGCTGPAGPAGPQGPAGAAPSDDGYDLTLVAAEATSRSLDSTHFEITLTGVHENVLAFQNRPHRGFGYFEVQSLVSLWPHMFGDGDGPPNASMVSRNLDGNSGDPIAFSMGPPSRDESNGAITFDMVLLQGSPAPMDRFNDVSLFIDPTAFQWIKIGLACGSAAVTIVLAAIEAGANPLADLGAGLATASCLLALKVYGVIK